MPLSGWSSVRSPTMVPPMLAGPVDQCPQSQIHEPQIVARSPSVGQAKSGSVLPSNSKWSRPPSSVSGAKLSVPAEGLPPRR
jgi:hypothetical protein